MVKWFFGCVIYLSLLTSGFLPTSAIFAGDKGSQAKDAAPQTVGVQKVEMEKIESTKEGESKTATEFQPKTTGVLVLAHGFGSGHGLGGEHGYSGEQQKTSPWESAVMEAVNPLSKEYPLEVAFGMAEPVTIIEAVHKLEQKGISEVVVIPLFISSHSPIIGNSQYILGLRNELPKTTSIKSLPKIESKVSFRMTRAIDDSPLIADILLEHAKELSINPAKETVILLGHGPNDEEENKLWLENMNRLAYYVWEKGGFRGVKTATLRMDAPKGIRRSTICELRTLVETYGEDGNVIVVPHFLAPGVEGKIVEALEGLTYVYNGKTLLPHHNISMWIKRMVEGEILLAHEEQ